MSADLAALTALTVRSGVPRYGAGPLQGLRRGSDAEANQSLFLAAPQLYPLCMRVKPSTWHEQLEPRYQLLRAAYGRWLDLARDTIGQ